jgi:hypothetical protein
VSGPRWRCPSCSHFLSLNNLEQCGLTTDVAKDLKDRADSSNDRVELSADRRFRLLAPHRRQNKKRSADGDGDNNSKTARTMPQDQEIVCID